MDVCVFLVLVHIILDDIIFSVLVYNYFYSCQKECLLVFWFQIFWSGDIQTEAGYPVFPFVCTRLCVQKGNPFAIFLACGGIIQIPLHVAGSFRFININV